MPASGARRLRSTSTASALSGDRYSTRQRASRGGTGANISRSRQARNAVSVLPVPVGARMSVDCAAAIAGQPCRWGRVGAVEGRGEPVGRDRRVEESEDVRRHAICVV